MSEDRATADWTNVRNRQAPGAGTIGGVRKPQPAPGAATDGKAPQEQLEGISESTLRSGTRLLAVHGEPPPEIVRALLTHLEEAGLSGAHVVIDLSGTTQAGGQLVSALVAADKLMVCRGQRLPLVCSGELKRLLRLTGLDRRLQLCDSRAAALASLGQ